LNTVQVHLIIYKNIVKNTFLVGELYLQQPL